MYKYMMLNLFYYLKFLEEGYDYLEFTRDRNVAVLFK